MAIWDKEKEIIFNQMYRVIQNCAVKAKHFDLWSHHILLKLMKNTYNQNVINLCVLLINNYKIQEQQC